MISISEKRRKNRSAHKEQLTLYQLGLLRDALDTEENRASELREQIKLQKTQGNKTIKNINNNIGKLQCSAVNFSQKLQQQQIMNQTLAKLVKFYESSIYQNKVEKYQDEKNKIQTDKYTEAKHNMLNCEKNLEKLLIKTNSADYQNKKKIDQVRTLRGQRAVFSNLLDKIQRENFELELIYKQLVIDRILNEKIEKSNLDELNKLEAYYSKVIETQEKNNEKQEQSFKHQMVMDFSGDQSSPKKSGVRLNHSNFTQILHSPTKVKRIHKKDMDGTKLIRNKTQQKETRKLEFQKKLKEIFFDLGVQSIEEIIEKKENLSVQLQYAYDRANDYYDKINELQTKIQEIKNHKTVKQLKNRNYVPDKLKQMQAKASNWDSQISTEIQQINSFAQELKTIQRGYKIDGDGQVTNRVIAINELIVKMTPLYVHQKKSNKRQSTNQKLNYILHAQSPQFKNCMQIFNEEELIKISKESLVNMESKRMSMAPSHKQKSHRNFA